MAAESGRWRLVFALGLITIHAFFLIRTDALFFVGISNYSVRFIDSFAILASNDALARGLDPYAPNPLDYFKRPHVYSKWWLVLGDLGLTRADNAWIGWALASVFLAIVAMFLRPRSWGEMVWYLVIAAAPPAIFALNRANNDLVIFALLSAVVPCVTHRLGGVRLLAVGLVGVAAALKFYPAAAALATLAGSRRREARERAIVLALALMAVAMGVASDVAHFSRVGPQPEGPLTFGAGDLLRSVGITGRAASAVAALAILVAGAVGWRWACRVPGSHRMDGSGRLLHFVLGASLLVGCFVAGRNYAYRWIFAIWLAPFLWSGARRIEEPVTWRRLCGVWSGLLVVLLWLDPLLSFLGGLLVASPAANHWLDRLYFAEQFLLWIFCLGLGVVLGAFARGVAQLLWSRDPMPKTAASVVSRK